MRKLFLRAALISLSAGIVIVAVEIAPIFFNMPYSVPYKLAGMFLLFIFVSHALARTASAYLDT